MRRFFAIPALCAVYALAAGSPWDDFLQRRRGGDPRAGWTAWVRSGDLPARGEPANDPVLQKLIIGRDLTLSSLGAAEAKDLWAQKGWGERPHWLLLTPAGEVAGTGPGKPTGEALLAALHAAGGRTRSEVREAFLREHPEQGEARLEAYQFAFRLALRRLTLLDAAGKVKVPAWHATGTASGPALFGGQRIVLPEGLPEAVEEELFGEWAAALENLLAVPGWGEEAQVVANPLATWDVSSSFRMRRLFAVAAREALDSLRADPYDAGRANFWMEALEASNQLPGTLAGLCQPTPGRLWPTPPIFARLLEPYRRRKDWDGLLRVISELTPQTPPQPLTRSGWEEYCRLHAALLANRAVAMANLGSWDQAGAALSEAREWGGGAGVREALMVRGGVGSGSPADMNAWRLLQSQALGREGPGRPMPALAAPMRLVVLGSPKWILAWSALSQSPDLAPWAPAELSWEVASPATHAQLRAKFQWGPEPRWALLQGGELKASGESCPGPRGLAAILEGVEPARLQRLQQLLASHPEHRGARVERVELLLKRMPDPRLEPTLAQDAAHLRLALEFGPGAHWKPDPDLWAGAAQQVLPRLETELRSWPSRLSLWEAWISWSRFHPAQPSTVDLAQSLPYWSPRADWRSDLPYPVQRAVAGELRRQGNFNLMRDWFRSAWDALDHRPASALRRGEREWLLEQRKEEETAIFEPLRDALRGLGCTAEQAELERQFREMMGR